MTEYEYDEFRGVSPSAAFFILWGFVGAGLIIGSIAGFATWYAMTGHGIKTFEKDMLDQQFANAARMLQMVSVLFMFFLPAVFTARLMSRKPFHYLGYQEKFNWNQLIITIVIILVCFPLVGALAELNQAIPISKSMETYFKKLENNYNSQVEALAAMRSKGEFIYSLIVMALLPAVFEETLFRGGLQQILIAWFKKPMLAIVITSIVFSAIHFSYYGFLPRFALGMVLGLLFYYSKSIWLNMIGHFINNAFALCLMYYLYLHGKPVKEATEGNMPIWVALPALIIIILLLRKFKQISFERNINKIPPMDGPSIESTLV